MIWPSEPLLTFILIFFSSSYSIYVIASVWNWFPKLCVIDNGERRPIIDHGTIIFSSIKIQETPHSIEEPTVKIFPRKLSLLTWKALKHKDITCFIVLKVFHEITECAKTSTTDCNYGDSRTINWPIVWSSFH